MAPSIYEFKSYKEFINAWLEAQPKAGHGFRKKFADAIGTQTGFVTQVLKGSGHFSAEHLIPLSKTMGLSSQELQFFLLLLHYERAGSREYRQHLQSQMDALKQERQDLKKRLKVEKFPSQVDQSQYFSTWLHACLHVMVTCEGFKNSPTEMANALNIPLEKVTEGLEFLLRAGFIFETETGYSTGDARLHLGTDSPYLVRHHSNWNLMALQKVLSGLLQKDLHYSSVISISKEDVAAIHEIFVQAIEKSKSVVRKSEGEKIYATTINFFEIA